MNEKRNQLGLREDFNQLRPLPWKKRTGCNLPVKLARPATRQRSLAGGTLSFWRETVCINEVSIPPDDCFTTVMAACVLQSAHFYRAIPGIDIANARFATNRGSTKQVCRFCTVGRGHLV